MVAQRVQRVNGACGGNQCPDSMSPLILLIAQGSDEDYMVLLEVGWLKNTIQEEMQDLCQLKKEFSQLVLQVPHWTLTQFVLWLDLKVAEFKVNGYMVLDDTRTTLPRWIESDILEAHETGPRHKHHRPCTHRHEKRRRKWRCRRDWGPGMGLGKRRHRDGDIMNAGNDQDNTLVEISDESSYSDVEFCSENMEPDLLIVPGDGSQKQNAPSHFPVSLTQVTTSTGTCSNKEPKPIGSSKRSSTDSVVENVNQISISSDKQRHKHISDNFHPSQSGDSISKGTSDMPLEISHGDNNNTVTSSAATIAAGISSSSPPAHDLEIRERTQGAEAIFTPKPKETMDVKPDLDLLHRRHKHIFHPSQIGDSLSKDTSDADFVPWSPVSSALLTYQGESPKRTDSPLELNKSNHQPDEVPDLLDDITKRYLYMGDTKLVWHRAVAACATYLIHTYNGQPTTADYKLVCKAMYDRYPSLGSLKGPRPWSCFSRAVSQKIRHTRFKIRQMGRLPASANNQDEQRHKKIVQNTSMFS